MLKKIFFAIVFVLAFTSFAFADKLSKERILTEFIAAVKAGNLRKVQNLVSRVDLNAKIKDKFSPMLEAVAGGHVEIVAFLLSYSGYNINKIFEPGQTLLNTAVHAGKLNVFKFLLQQPDIDVNAGDKNGNTPLMNAAFYGDEEMAKALLEKPGININAQNVVGNTALIFGAMRGYKNIVKLMLEQPGINIRATAHKGETAFMWAVKQIDDIETIKLFLQIPDLDINAQDDEGWTALMHAALLSRKETVRLLINAGADPDIEGPEGETFFTYANKDMKTFVTELITLRRYKRLLAGLAIELNFMNHVSHI